MAAFGYFVLILAIGAAVVGVVTCAADFHRDAMGRVHRDEARQRERLVRAFGRIK